MTYRQSKSGGVHRVFGSGRSRCGKMIVNNATDLTVTDLARQLTRGVNTLCRICFPYGMAPKEVRDEIHRLNNTN